LFSGISGCDSFDSFEKASEVELAVNNQEERAVDSPSKRAATADNEGSDHVTKTIDDFLKLESLERTVSERVAAGIATFTGSMLFIWLHVVWFALWIAFNIPWLGFQPIDSFPFTLLTMIVSLEAIFLSAFILMSENRQGRLADRRARVNLQVDMIAEREITKLMGLVVDIHTQLKIPRPMDLELDNMQKATNIGHLTEAAQTVEASNGVNSASKKASK
jgi:uncharacterized membrane protein